MPVGETSQAITGGFRLDAKTQFMENGPFSRYVDFDGDGKAEFFATNLPASPDPQLGAVGAKTGIVTATLAWAFTRAIDGATLATGVIQAASDLTGDAKSDLVHMDSSRGLRVLQRNSDGTLRGGAFHPYGNYVNDWLLRYEDAYYGPADVDGDGNQELVMGSSAGFVVFDVSATGALSVYNTAQRGRYLEGGRAYIDSLTHVVNAGRFWGGSEEQLLLRSSTGFSIAYVPSRSSGYTSFVSIEYAPFGEMQTGGWRIGSDNYVHGIGDVNGDGREDFVLSSPWGIGVLTAGDWFSGGTSFKTIAVLPWGTSVDGLAVNGFTSGTSWYAKYDAVDDFDGDGLADILVSDTANARVILFSYDPVTKTLKKKAALGKGQVARGGWNYDGYTDVYRAVGRFGDATRASMLERSGWGVGMLGVDAAGFYLVAATPYDATPTWCGDAACNGGETCMTCAADCGSCPPPPSCGDGICNGGESCSTCDVDCGRCPPHDVCGTGVCDASETCSSCPSDCGHDFKFCMWCPTGGTYNKWPVPKHACSYEAALRDAEAGISCTGGTISDGDCPSP
ncbi:MAG: VCBS repeat-containing protein [Kofleriaceae bacterium]|nr:VCBS repeat-containing protein [Kofleriaceae bacterium]